jgi:tetratricopeptide (TPR) repeat protein
MFAHSLTAKRMFLNLCLLIIAAATLFPSLPVTAQEPDYDSERRRAFQLLNESKMLEALPVLEKLAVRNPQDGEVIFMLGFCLFARSREITDPVARKQARARARSSLIRAKELGQTEPVIDQLIAGIPADGSDLTGKFSRNAEADQAMNTGESAYTRGDLDQAFDAYTRALQLDPGLYEAALFAGDMKFKKGYNLTGADRGSNFDQAGEWFAKAITINPDRETAYRYWANTLLAHDKDEEALPKYIDAIVAEPYNQLVYTGLYKWGQKNKAPLRHPLIEIPANVSSPKSGEVNITVDDAALKGSDSDGSAAWMMYGIVRAGWMNKKDGGRSDKFAQAYPKETAYRHSLAEELDALRGVAEGVRTQTKENRVKKLTPSLENLMKLTDAGLVEAYVLFVRADEGIAEDYIPYRQANREKLRRYWREFVIGAK